MWASGDYGSIAELVWDVACRPRRAGWRPSGEAVLDVACGTGNAAIPAAEAGARVAGSISPRSCSRPAKSAPLPRASRSSGSRAMPRHCHSRTRASTWSSRRSAACSPPATRSPHVSSPGSFAPADGSVVHWTPAGIVGDSSGRSAHTSLPSPVFTQPPVLSGRIRTTYVRSSREPASRSSSRSTRSTSASIQSSKPWRSTSRTLARSSSLASSSSPRAAGMPPTLTSSPSTQGYAAEDGSLDFPAEYLVIIGRKN